MSHRRSHNSRDLHVLSISLDSSIADQTSEAYARQRAYASHFASYTVVTKTDDSETGRIDDGPLRVYPTNSSSRYSFLLDSYRLGSLQSDVDVITTQDPFALGMVGLALAWRLDARLHVQVHTDFLNNNVWRRESLDHRIYERLGRFVLPQADAIRVGTDYEAKKIREFVGEGTPIHIAPVKIQFEDVVATSANEGRLREELDIGNRPVVLFAGRFVPAKDLSKWTTVAAGIRDRTQTNPVFVLVGDGPERTEIESRIISRGLDARFPGWVNRQKLGEYYALADVFLITSAYEGTSRVIIEAGMNETPVVATPFAGAHDNIVDGKTGYVAENPSELAARVVQLLDDRDRQERMGEAARRYLEERYDEETFVDDYVDFISAGR